MISATSSLNSASSVALADRIFRGLDSDRNGKVTENELTQALSKNSPDGTDAGKAAKEILQLLDTGNKGYLTEQDVEKAVQQTQTGPSTARRPPGGPPPPRGEKPETDSESEDATALSLDSRDTNGDGTVTMQEEMSYYQKQYAEQTEPPAAPRGSHLLAYG